MVYASEYKIKYETVKGLLLISVKLRKL